MKKHHPKPGFASFSFSSAVQDAIEEVGFKRPTDVQLAAIPAITEGRDVLARAETGSGKTAAFVLPLLDNLSNKTLYGKKDTDRRYSGSERARGNSVQILVLVPTRELSIQIAGVFEQFAKHIKPGIKCQSVYGGVKINPQMMALRGGADVLVATPGRLLDLVDQNAIKFNQLKTQVIDEVDRLMKGDFEEEIKQITRLLPNKRQNLMFTATFPDSIRPIIRQVLNDPLVINIDESSEQLMLDQHAVTVNHDRKNDLLAYLLKENDWQQVLIFCSAKRTCDELVMELEARDVQAVAMHGNKRQPVRAAALKGFKAGETRILIATDVAARGLDIEYLPCVINYDLPRSPNDYIHRVGRTARAGQPGQAISLISHHEYQHFSVIEKRNDIHLEREQVEGFEADEIAPPPPERKVPKKKPKWKNSKKRAMKKLGASKKDGRQKESSVDVPADRQIPREKTREKSEGKAAVVNANVWGVSKG